MSAVLEYLPRGNTLSDEAWNKRHLLLQWLLLLHVPGLFLFGVLRGYRVVDVAETVAVPFALLVLGRLMRTRRLASFFITAGLVFCSAALVGLSGGTIEAHFHFFIMIGFIALYQDWVPFLWNIVFTVLSHGFGSAFRSDLIFNHHAGIAHPWTWSVLHGVAVLAACVGVVLFWKQTEDEQQKTIELRGQLAATELGRRRFTADLLVNLARRNQNLLYRQLDLLNQLEENERDPDALADLFRLDHLATRIRRNAESLLVLSGEEPARKWGRPVLLVDVVRAAIAETEDLDRVDFAVDESLAVSGRAVADLTHLVAELIENAVHFSPPGVGVMVRTRPYLPSAGAQVLTIEDWGVGMSAGEVAEANRILDEPREVDLSMSQRLGLHVVARLAHRYAIAVSLTQTPGGGVTAVVILPAGLFDIPDADADLVSPRRVAATRVAPPVPMARTATVAPPARPLPAAPVLAVAPAVPVPTVPPIPTAPPVTVATRFAEPAGLQDTSDTWHAWWTPHQQADGPSTQDGNGTGRSADEPAPPGRAGVGGPGVGGPGVGGPGVGGPGVGGPGGGAPEAGGPGGGAPEAGGPWAGEPASAGPTAARPTAGGPAPAALAPAAASPAAPAPAAVSPAAPAAAPSVPIAQAGVPTSARTAGAAGPAAPAGPPAPTGGLSPAGSPARQAVAAPTGPATAPGGPAPVGAGRPASPAGTAGAGPTLPAGAVSPAEPPRSEMPAAGSPSGPARPEREAGPAGPRLTQRVPQANLVEGLRRPAAPTGSPQPLRNPEQAREALSRFQASQRAARSQLDQGSVDDPSNRTGSGGADEGRT